METGNVVVVTDRLEWRLKFATLLAGPRTPGMKSTARRRVGRAGYFTGKDNTTHPSLRIRDWSCRD